MSEAIKPTPGVWRFYTEPQPNGCPVVGANGVMICMLAHSVNYADQAEEAVANARIVAEAGTVHHETGLTPRQLVEQRDALAEALAGLDEAYCRAGTPLSRDERTEDRKRLIAARAALALVKGEKP